MWPKAEVIYVNGNHDFYGSRREDALAIQRNAAKETGLHYLENDSVEINGIRFLGYSLWTDFNLFGEDNKHWCIRDAQQGLNDFRVIHEGNRHFCSIDAVVLNESSVAWLKQKLKHE